ncbi:unnamed protein product [Scytosiphon promiscuus]
MSADDQELLSLLTRCEPGMQWELRLKVCQELLHLIESQRVRDVDKLPPKMYAFLLDSVRLGWQQPGEQYAQACWTGLVGLPEFEPSAAGHFVDDGFLQELCDRFQAGVASEGAFLRDTLHWAYMTFPKKRRLLREKIGALLGCFVRTPSRNFHVTEVLEVVRLIIMGFPSLTKVHRSLLTDVLLPLHEPNQMAVWSLQQPLIETYHEALVGCLVAFLQLQPDLAEVVFKAIAQAWPQGFNSNTPKEVLLLHELEALIKFVPERSCDAVVDVLMPKIIDCLRVENSRVVERALYLFKDEGFLEMLATSNKTTFTPLLSALLRGGEPFWNPTVNKASCGYESMTARVLESLEEKNSTAFAAACESVWGNEATPTTSSEGCSPKKNTREAPFQPRPKGGDLLPSMTLKDAMGSWRPSTNAIRSIPKPTRNPPAAVTGVAPWAFQAPKPTTRWRTTNRSEIPTDGTEWAKPPIQSLKRLRMGAVDCNKSAQEGDCDASKISPASGIPDDPSCSPFCQGGDDPDEKSVPPLDRSKRGSSGVAVAVAATPEGPGYRKVREFIRRIKPNETEETSGPSWQELQLEPTPTLLPELRFHDLVFGHELGSGSFSVVKYARHIDKGKSRSQWPEFAVKIISTSKIQELNYEKSVTNEIACLRIFSHPGIARLVSSFRWRDGAYLVLEYASRGDLHSHVKKHGSLSEVSTRFVIGEVVAALCSIHSRGFVFGDLKPENILITESGHVKVADFGACRPVSEDAKTSLNRSRHALRTLRDGDWRAAAGLPPNPLYTIPTDKEEAPRAEGTAAYMSPEVARGGTPGIAADAWALGCVLFLCLSARPPIFAETDEMILSRVVRFSIERPGSQGSGSDHPTLPSGISESPRLLLGALMEPDPTIRLGVEHAAKHEFLAHGGVDVFSLHRQKPVELVQGTVAPAPNAAWSRRQNSMIWAPMPQEYRFDAVSQELVTITETEVERGAPFVRHFGSIREPPSVAT